MEQADRDDADFAITPFERAQKLIPDIVDDDERFAVYMIRVKSESKLGRALHTDPISVLSELDELEGIGIDRSWSVSVQWINAVISIMRVHRFELWMFVPGRRQATALLYKVSPRDDAAS
jgi:hypothetical protein